MLRKFIVNVYTRITETPTYTLGRWGHHKDAFMWKKSDLNTEDHCGCDEMRQQYLYKKKLDSIDSLITEINDKSINPQEKQK